MVLSGEHVGTYIKNIEEVLILETQNGYDKLPVTAEAVYSANYLQCSQLEI